MNIEEDLNMRRLLARQYPTLEIREGWQFRVEIEDMPEGFEMFVKDISYGPVEITTEAIKVGSVTMTFPVSAEPVAISMTMRDHKDQRVFRWFTEWAGKTVNGDGTVNLPKDYLREWRYFPVNAGKGESPTEKYKVFPTKLGDISQSVEDKGFIEFPLTFMQLRT